jgi:hypothetical protein
LTLIQLLEELGDTERAVTLPAGEVERLVERFGDRSQAVRELKSEHFTKMLEASSAASLIEKVTEAYHRWFRNLMDRYQNASDRGEATQQRKRLPANLWHYSPKISRTS